jgi:Holliday junction resolvase
MPNRQYEKGTRFEGKVRDDLEDLGYSVIRAAGSKGDSKIDLIALHSNEPMLFIQCKADGKISKKEWDRVFTVSSWYAGTVPLLAYNGVNGRGVRYTRIEGLRVPYARVQPSRAYFPWGVKTEVPEPDFIDLQSPDYHG